MKSPVPFASRQNGFTLIELLVSLALLSMVAVMLLGGVTTAAGLARRSDGRRIATDEIAAAQLVLRNHIERTRPVMRLDSTGGIVDAQGTVGEWAFYAAPAANAQPNALQRYRLMLAATGDLILYSANGLSNDIDLRARGLEGWQPVRLLSGVRSLSLDYFGPVASGGASRWQSFWYDRSRLPSLVRINIEFTPGDDREWPDLVIRPWSSIGSACVIDRLTGRCGDQT